MLKSSSIEPLKVGCFGEAMIELKPNGLCTQANLGVAGDSLNTAIYLKRYLGLQHHVSFISMVGSDVLSNRIEEFVASEGILTKLLKRHPQKLPGLYAITIDDAGERYFAYWRESSAARALFSRPHGIKFEELDAFDVVFATAISLAILTQHARDGFFEWLSSFRASGGCFVFDSNYRPTLWDSRAIAQSQIARAWENCDIALPSLDDELALFGDRDERAVLSRLRGYGFLVGGLKRGSLGPVDIFDTDDDGISLATMRSASNVVDTTAAGDSFNGAYVATYLTTKDSQLALRAGHELACEVIGHPGAIVPRPR
ncbi:MAG: sugar kinase [Pseudomonadota bacterium]